MAFWSAENATKAYLSTLKTDQRSKEPNVAEFISALAAGNNARKIAVACAGAANTDILVALIAAANQTRGQVVCVLRGIEELIISKKMLEPSEIHQIHFVVGESSDTNLINDHFGEADFVLVDCNLVDHQDIVRKIVNHHEENARSGGGSGVAVVVGYNAFSRGSWRFSDGRKTQFLPIGEGLLVTRVNDNGKYNQKMMMNKNNHHYHHHDRVRKSHWVVKVDKCTGEEHVFRVRVPQGEAIVEA
ncbi:hypothetical protein Bca4012_041347 [Brassica carinata]|uniref:DUF1442 family protein n=3 Tax=Brassica TaxID=3705 RepID=A0A8X7R4F1_BRACI|nr:uncharacterized protein BNAC09G05580D [Brassica napus]KAG2278334.1 hypothetical protein Bca52824_060889 [Brassica carinata]KAH0856440.1 hypothetical protein HID58_084701 [Brassica napus]CAF1716507.1 unnamed protein product [Brassica napus]VDD28439.1 unnamed protein product [Brassica oleracea]